MPMLKLHKSSTISSMLLLNGMWLKEAGSIGLCTGQKETQLIKTKFSVLGQPWPRGGECMKKTQAITAIVSLHNASSPPLLLYLLGNIHTSPHFSKYTYTDPSEKIHCEPRVASICVTNIFITFWLWRLLRQRRTAANTYAWERNGELRAEREKALNLRVYSWLNSNRLFASHTSSKQTARRAGCAGWLVLLLGLESFSRQTSTQAFCKVFHMRKYQFSGQNKVKRVVNSIVQQTTVAFPIRSSYHVGNGVIIGLVIRSLCSTSERIHGC